MEPAQEPEAWVNEWRQDYEDLNDCELKIRRNTKYSTKSQYVLQHNTMMTHSCDREDAQHRRKSNPKTRVKNTTARSLLASK